MRHLPLVVLVAGMMWIPSSAHAYPDLCIWSVPGDDSMYAMYDQVFTGKVLENKPTHRPVFFVDTILKGRKVEAGSTIELLFDDRITPLPPLLVEGDRYTVPANAEWVPTQGQGTKGQRIAADVHTTACAQISEPIVPADYGLSVIDSVHPPLSRHRS